MRKSLLVGALVLALAAALLSVAARAEPVAYPSAEVAPANLLRVQVRVDNPLPYPPGIDAFRLEDERGAAIAEPFYDIPVLSQDGLVVSLLLHPGRVKSGLAANAELGRALEPGRTVTLRGVGPMAGLSRTWRIGPPVARAIDAAAWALTPPRAGTRAPLEVGFDRSLEVNAIAYLAVADARGNRVRGVAAFAEGEHVWRFTPEEPWTASSYAVRVHANLEDVAGNRLCAPFEAVALSEVECAHEAIPWRPGP